MANEVVYTDVFRPKSEAVNAFYYNKDTDTLVVDYRGGDLYEYSGLSSMSYRNANLWEDIKSAEEHGVSIGREWVPWLKKNGGGAKWLGRRSQVTYRGNEESPALSDATTVVVGANDYEVVFSNGNKDAKHLVKSVASFDDAAKSVEEFGKTLGLTFKVRSVTLV